MTAGSKTRGKLDREAVRVFHALPLMVLALCAAGDNAHSHGRITESDLNS